MKSSRSRAFARGPKSVPFEDVDEGTNVMLFVAGSI